MTHRPYANLSDDELQKLFADYKADRAAAPDKFWRNFYRRRCSEIESEILARKPNHYKRAKGET